MSVVVSGNFTATGQSASFQYQGDFNVSLSGFGVATVNVERSYDSGTTWVVVDTFTANAERYATEPEPAILWRFNCAAYTSGTIKYRFGGK